MLQTKKKQRKYYWQAYITRVTTGVEVTDNDKQEESTTTLIRHIFQLDVIL
jgi:hypothetical protein